jgi:A/G-specific adenine glycosylase
VACIACRCSKARDALQAALPVRARTRLQDDAPFLHVLTHKDLHLHPVVARLPADAMSGREGGWFASGEWPQLGLPAPVRRLLERGQPTGEA